MEDRAVTWASEAHRKADVRRRKRAEIKHNVYMFGHKVFWRTLSFTGLARTYSKTMCKFGLYRKFPDGRCQWCGNTH